MTVLDQLEKPAKSIIEIIVKEKGDRRHKKTLLQILYFFNLH